jgi:hypothetical protein
MRQVGTALTITKPAATSLSTDELRTRTAQASHALGRVESDVEMRGPIATLSKKISNDDRKLLEWRRAGLTASLRSLSEAGTAAMDRANKAILEMISTGWPVHYAKLESPLQIAAAFIVALQPFPVWAIESVCGALARGAVEEIDPAFIPTSAIVARLCSAKIADMTRERARYQRVLSIRDIRGPDSSPEERARALSKYEAWKAGQQPEPPSQEAIERREEMDRWRQERAETNLLKEYKHHGITPVRDKGGRLVSLSLARSLGLLHQPKAEMD